MTALEVEIVDATDGRISLSLPEAFLARRLLPLRRRGGRERLSVTTWVKGALKVERDVTNEPA